MQVRTIAVISIAIIITILAMQNLTPIEVRVFFWQTSFPLVFVILITLILGFIAGYVVKSLLGVKRRMNEKNDDNA
ncbi:MAG: LapA family protein [Chrysiogenales bacterium]|nr:MAG: LapA family protein [Chrysiogenales bacterium]